MKQRELEPWERAAGPWRIAAHLLGLVAGGIAMLSGLVWTVAAALGFTPSYSDGWAPGFAGVAIGVGGLLMAGAALVGEWPTHRSARRVCRSAVAGAVGGIVASLPGVILLPAVMTQHPHHWLLQSVGVVSVGGVIPFLLPLPVAVLFAASWAVHRRWIDR